MYPRPQLRRTSWHPLDGEWDFAASAAAHPTAVQYGARITVPYTHETPRSGVNDQSAHPVVWYRWAARVPQDVQPRPGERLMLHFGAVDWDAQVWVGGQFVGRHEGGYTPFSFDITALVGAEPTGAELLIEVRAADDAHDMAQPRGKQDWRPRPHGIWYPRTTGIWQSVWLERLPAAHLTSLHWTPHLERFSLHWEAQVSAESVGRQLRVTLSLRGRVIAQEQALILGPRVSRTVALPDPGIDDARDDFLWSPEHPQLIDATVEILDGEQILDEVHSYAALRSVGMQDGHFALNGRPYLLKLALDQGYWPEGGLSASAEELRADVELAKTLGFNGVRKHQKIEHPAWLECCDRLGLLVWEELPSAYTFCAQSVRQLTQTWLEAVARDRSHPCIVAWVPLNESWGVPDLPVRADQRDFMQALYHLTRALDSTRPVIGNDGWEQVCGDLLTIHDYAGDPQALLERYATRADLPHTLDTFRSAGRAITLAGYALAGQPVILSEFGGIAYGADGTEGWGYSVVGDSATFLERYETLMRAVHRCAGLSGFCYTQLTDTYQEINGLSTMARVPKADPLALGAATRGSGTRGSSTSPDHPLGYSARWVSKEEHHD